MTELDDRILQESVNYYQFTSRYTPSFYSNVAQIIINSKDDTPETLGQIEKKEFFGKMVESLFQMNWELDLLLQFNIHLQSNLARKVVKSILSTIESCKEIISDELYSHAYSDLLKNKIDDEENNEVEMIRTQLKLCQKIVEDINHRVKYENSQKELEKVQEDTKKINRFIEKLV